MIYVTKIGDCAAITYGHYSHLLTIDTKRLLGEFPSERARLSGFSEAHPVCWMAIPFFVWLGGREWTISTLGEA